MMKWLNPIRPRVFESVVLAAYAVIVASAIAHHEPWADEAQAWQLARTLKLSQLFLFNLHYEVHPILWYAFLRTLHLVGISYTGMHWVCGMVGVTATAILLFRSPFPIYLKVLLPFTYFLIFQYVVVARGYTLIPPLLYLIALFWKKGPVALAILLGLLANVEMHAAAISSGFAVVYLIQEIRSGAHKDARRRNRLILSAAILACCFAFALATAWPAKDLQLSGITAHSRSVFIIAGQALVWGLSDPLVLAFAFWVLFLLCLDERQSLIFILPILFFAMFATNYLSFWHAGLMVPLIITVMWVTWPESTQRKSHYELACRVVFAIVCCVQIVWSVKAIKYDYSHFYSGDPAAALFLKPYVERNTTIAVTYIGQPDNRTYNAVGVLPYFPRNIFANWNAPYWWASKANNSEGEYAAMLTAHPAMIIVETRENSWDPVDIADPKVQVLFRSGYRFTNDFCGVVPYRTILGMRMCHMVFQYSDGSESSTAQTPVGSPKKPTN